MGRKSKKAAVTLAVQQYLQMNESRTSEECILDVKHVAAALGVSRTSLYKYDLVDSIRAAARRQLESANLASSATYRSRWREQLRQLRDELATANSRNKHLLLRLQLVEANAARLAIDPEELFQPLHKPMRSSPP